MKEGAAAPAEGPFFSLPYKPKTDQIMAHRMESVTDANFEEFVQAPASIVAYGIAPCQPCSEYDPILQETVARYPDLKVGKAKMHVPGQCREIKKRYRFETYPTTHFFSNGNLLLTREGKLESSELDQLIKDYLLEPPT